MSGVGRPAAGAEFPALGTTAFVAVTRPWRLASAVTEVEAEIAAADQAYSRFRADSELVALYDATQPVSVSPLLGEALAVAIRAAEATAGVVDPTVGAAMAAIGYDRDYADLVSGDQPLPPEQQTPGAKAIAFDPVRRQVRLSPGTRLDLGATGKALAVDRAVARAAAMTGCGVLVSIGGDLATAGEAPDGGWSIGIADDHRAEPGQIQQTVAISHGAIATSSTSARTWERASTPCHHILDPRRCQPAAIYWRTVSVAAESCVAANIASTAAIVEGANARSRLIRAGLPARLVAAAGSVVTLGGWPDAAERAA